MTKKWCNAGTSHIWLRHDRKITPCCALGEPMEFNLDKDGDFLKKMQSSEFIKAIEPLANGPLPKGRCDQCLSQDSATTTGSGASLFAASTQTPMVGHVSGISVTNFGLDYTSTPTITLNRNVLVKNVSGSFAAGDTLTSHDGTVVDFDNARNILELKTSVTFNQDDTITSITGATATVHQSTPAKASSSIGTVGTTVGNFVNDKGKLSVDTMRVQDSLYYQDYSYVVRIGQSINEWRESVRRSVHPAGWNVFGEVSFASQVAVRIQTPAAGSVGDSASPDTFTPELASTFTNLFTTIFGRRLGTLTDSTKRANGNEGSSSILPNGKREVTLESVVAVRMDGPTRLSGGAFGSTLNLLPQYAFSVPPTDTSQAIPHYPGIYRTAENNHDNRAYFNIDQFGQFRINQVSVATNSTETFDSTANKFDSTTVSFDGNDIRIPDAAFSTRINVPPPGEIQIRTSGAGSVNAFDNNFMTFDNTTNTFDEAVGSGNTRTTAGAVYTSFDENAITFDSSTQKFDIGS